MKTILRALALPILIAFLLPACFISRSTGNEPLQPQSMDTLKPGTSTATDVANALGAPNEVVQLGKRMAWRYDFTTAKQAGFSIIILTFVNNDARADRAWFFFDENSVLQYAGRTFQAEHTEYSMPWQHVNAREVTVRALIILALVSCTSCVTGTYERDIVFEPVNDAAVLPLKVGVSDVGDALAQLGAPLYVWEGANESVVLAYGSKEDRGWGVRAARSAASLSYDSLAQRLEGWIFVFGTDNKLQIVRKGLLRDLAAEARHPPAFVE